MKLTLLSMIIRLKAVQQINASRHFVLLFLVLIMTIPASLFAGPPTRYVPPRPSYTPNRSYAPNRSTNSAPQRQRPTFIARPPRPPSRSKSFNAAALGGPNVKREFKSAVGPGVQPPKNWSLSKSVASIRNKFAMGATNTQAIKLRKALMSIKLPPPKKLVPSPALKPSIPGPHPELGTWEGTNTSGYTPPANVEAIREKAIAVGSESRFLSAEFQKAKERTEVYPSQLNKEQRARVTEKLSSLNDFNNAARPPGD
jgi:hypothetical protein